MSELVDSGESPLQYPLKRRRSSSFIESPAKVRVLENDTGKSIPNMNVIVEIEPIDEYDADDEKTFPLLSQNCKDNDPDDKQSLLTALNVEPDKVIDENSNKNTIENASVKVLASVDKDLPLSSSQNCKDNNCGEIATGTIPKKIVNENSNEKISEDASLNIPGSDGKNVSLWSPQKCKNMNSVSMQPVTEATKMVNGDSNESSLENDSDNMPGADDNDLPSPQNLEDNDSDDIQPEAPNPALGKIVEENSTGNTSEKTNISENTDSIAGQSKAILNSNENSAEIAKENFDENTSENGRISSIRISDSTDVNNKSPLETSNTNKNALDNVRIDNSEENGQSKQSTTVINAPENTNESSKENFLKNAEENLNKTTSENAEPDASDDNDSSKQPSPVFIDNEPVNLIMGENNNTVAENTEIPQKFCESMYGSICSSESVGGDPNERNFILDQDSNDSTFTCDSSVASSLSTSFEKSLATDFLSNNRIPHRPDTIRNRINALCSEDTISDVSETSLRPVRRDSVRKRIDALCRDMIIDIKRKKVDIFTEDIGPKWYEANSCTITKSIVPSKVIEAFNFLPTYGKPKSKTDLPEFLDQKVQEFVGSGLTNEEFLKLQRLCSKDLLKTGKEPVTKLAVGSVNTGFMNEFLPPQMPHMPKSPDGYKLKIIRKHKLRAENDPCNTYTKKLKYRGVRVIPISQPSTEEASTSTVESDLQPGQDLVFTVRIYRPFSFFQKHTNNTKVNTRHSLFSRNVVLLGRQKLTDLRDRIVCPNDVDMRIDVSDRVDETPLTCAKELFPSGFLFINNVFYVDTRSGCHDISGRIRRWAAARPGLGHFPVRDMAQTRIDDIALKLGHPEVYMHQGNCEHLFTFSDIRLLSPYDPLSLTQYPCHTAISQNQTLNCTTCAEYPAKYITTNSERVPFDPSFFCDTCLRLYLYRNGKKIGDFKAYSYRGNEINMLKPQG